MKLLRVGEYSKEIPAVLDKKNKIRDITKYVEDLNPKTLNFNTIKKIKNLDLEILPEIDSKIRIGSCIANPSNFFAIGLNYKEHAEETGAKIPEYPVVFNKSVHSIVGPNDNVIIPKNSSKADWEVELGVVVGKTAKYVDEKSALDHVAGYCVINDLTEREFQLERSGQWIMGKSCDTFGPIGPWLVTTDEVGDPQNLDIWLEVDGKRYQNGNTRTMIFGVAYLIHYLSQFFTLHPGDIISTGTPSGVGMGHKPNPIFLRSGQTMTLGIEKLGTQNQFTVDEKEVY